MTILRRSTGLPHTRRAHRFLRALAVVVAIVVSGAACTSTTAPSQADSGVVPFIFQTQTFAGTLSQSESGFYSFIVTQQGPVSLTLAAVQEPGGGALNSALGIGFGIPSGTGCARFESTNTSPGLAAQLLRTLNPGTYCAAVFDVGSLTGAVNFAMRIKHP